MGERKEHDVRTRGDLRRIQGFKKKIVSTQVRKQRMHGLSGRLLRRDCRDPDVWVVQEQAQQFAPDIPAGADDRYISHECCRSA